MSANKPDISQIKKYLAGELDARAMHELERQALNDPFLMDALEGYERSGADQQSNLDDLTDRLQQRTQVQKRRTLWPALGMAASLLLFVSVGAWWLLQERKVPTAAQQPVVVQAIKPPQQKALDTLPALTPPVDRLASTRLVKPVIRQKDVIQPPITVHNPAVGSAAPTNERITTNSGYLNLQDTSATPNLLNDVVVTAYPPQRKVSVTGAVGLVRLDSVSLGNALAGRVAGISIQRKKGNPSAVPDVRIRGMASVKGNEPLYIVDGILADKKPVLKPEEIASVNVLKDTAVAAIYGSRAANGVMLITTKARGREKAKQRPGNEEIMLTGQVLGHDDKQPLPGVAVTIAGQQGGVQTDAQGRFALKVHQNDVLKFGYVGYEGQSVNVKDQDKLQVLLKENNQALSEVVVVGYGTTGNVTEEAHPMLGWTDFKNYLKNASSPDGKSGIVKISFVVNADNSLSDFKVKKSLSFAADQQAVEVIKNGPAWQANVNGQPERVTVRVRFVK